ncbi:MAG: thiol-disulfide oxidoreductase DCC family protein [Janthinobacterium lividum]
MAAQAPPILLFDGVCNLCHGVVQFIIRHDPRGQFRFVALQSVAGQALLAAHGLAPTTALNDPDSVVLLQAGRAYQRSAAVLQVARQLGWPWRLLAAGAVLPLGWRDALYGYVARHRYRWFGRQQACLLPTPALRARFLE